MSGKFCVLFECEAKSQCLWPDRCAKRAAPSPQPEMPEGWHFDPAHGGLFYQELPGRQVIPVTLLRALLATQGLTIVGPAELARRRK